MIRCPDCKWCLSSAAILRFMQPVAQLTNDLESFNGRRPRCITNGRAQSPHDPKTKHLTLWRNPDTFFEHHVVVHNLWQRSTVPWNVSFTKWRVCKVRAEANRVESHGIYILLTKALRKSHETMHDDVYFPAFGLPPALKWPKCTQKITHNYHTQWYG